MFLAEGVEKQKDQPLDEMTRMRIAIIGTGISGMTVAHLLHPEHELTIFEAGAYAGGHTNTVQVEKDSGVYAVDTGFIVHNDWTYPHYMKLLEQIGIESLPTEMSFSVSNEITGLEYNGHTLDTLFAQRLNLVRPSFWSMIREILRFNREVVEHEQEVGEMLLKDYLEQHRYSALFQENYIVPMAAAIWSASTRQIQEFPMRTFIRFFRNHGLLNVSNRPQWRVIRGGSQAYMQQLVAPFRQQIRLNTLVQGVRRFPTHVEVQTESGRERFDALIVATHSDQALAMLQDPSISEREILSSIPYQSNEAVLHEDTSLMPRSRKAWASWNVRITPELQEHPEYPVAVTYNMNILQHLNPEQPFLVTLNETSRIAPEKVIKRIQYAHPVFTDEGVRAQRRHAEINGVNRTYFCGAYWRYGFHEDGVISGLRVAEYFGKSLDGDIPVRLPELGTLKASA